MDAIVIRNMVLEGVHGATPKEHENPQRFEVNLEIGYHQPWAGLTDDLTKTLDYRAAKRAIAEVIAGPRQNLVESLAEKIAERILAQTNACRVTVSIVKLDIWQGVGQPGVRIVRQRIPARLDLRDFDLEGVMAELVNYGAVSMPLLPESRRNSLLTDALTKEYVEREKYIKTSGVRQELSGCDDFRSDDTFSLLREDFTELLQLKFSLSGYRLVEFFSQPPNFTELSLQKYQAGSIGITPHRDGLSCADLVVIFLLGGDGKFATCDDRAGNNPRYVDTTPGNAILMRAPGFMGSSHRPFHFVSDITSERITFGLRQKR